MPLKSVGRGALSSMVIGGLVIFNQENATSERLLLSRVHDLRIQPLPVWTDSLAYRA